MNSSIVKYKVCTVCKVKQRQTAFYDNGRGGKASVCKKCHSQRRRDGDGYGTRRELHILKMLSPEARLNYYRTMHRRDRWDAINPVTLRAKLADMIRKDGHTGII